MKRYWIEKCCFKFKKPTGAVGDPKRDMILRCQWIQQRIHDKSSLESEGDNGLNLDTNEEEDEVALVLGGDLGGANHSNTNTPSVLVDGGYGVAAVEEGGIPTIPPVNTHQLTKVHYSPPLTQTQDASANAIS